MFSVFNLKELELLLEDFYRITQIRITVFDDRFQEVVSYPDSRPQFCQIIRSCNEGRSACAKCDAEACAYAGKQNKTYIYCCHAGLTEAIMPLHVGKVLVGYLLFGHVFAYDSLEVGWKVIEKCCRNYPVDSHRLEASLGAMPLISRKYIRSAARVLHMTASFLVMERMATLQEDTTAAKLDAYLSENYTSPITAEHICNVLNIGRSKLFKLSQELYGVGPAEHIRTLRIEKAKKMLEEQPGISIAEVGQDCGYGDYNYFIAVFSRQEGLSPGMYRKRHMHA